METTLSAAQAVMKKENGGSAIKRRILNYLAKVGLQGSTTENLCQELGILIQTAYVDINSLKRNGLVTTKKDAEGKDVRCPTSSGRTAAVLVLASLLPQPVIVQPSLTPAEQTAAALKEVKMANQLAKKFGGILTPQLLESGFIIYQGVNNNPCLLSPDVSELEHRDREEAEMGGGSTGEHP